MQNEQYAKLTVLIDNLYDVIDQRKEQAEAHLEVIANSSEIDTSLEDLRQFYQRLGNQTTIEVHVDVEKIQASVKKSLASLDLLIERHFRNEIETVSNFEREARTCIQRGLQIDQDIIHHRAYSSFIKCNFEKKLENLLAVYLPRGKIRLDKDELRNLAEELNSTDDIIELANGDWRVLLFAASNISNESKSKLKQSAEINEFGTTTKKVNKETWMSIMGADILAAKIGWTMNTNSELQLTQIIKVLKKL